MKRRSGLTVLELLLIVVVVGIIAAVVMPLLMTTRCPAPMASHCQSNMNQIGKAMKMYLSDWDDIYPPNRTMRRGVSVLSPDVRLSEYDEDSDGVRGRYRYGVNWVEALQPYVAKVTDGEAVEAWRCPAASRHRATGAGPNARVSYAFNANLVERSEGWILNAGNLMMIRELDRLYDAVLRPVSPSQTSKDAPRYAFLQEKDVDASPDECKLHGEGSYILFADGHVKTFSIAYFPDKCEWDKKTRQWYNYVNLPSPDPRNKYIAVSLPQE
jgi:prepilin-type processing-associated H-X9-DG protein